MQEPSEQTTARTQAVLRDSALVGDWVLDPQASSIRFKTRSMWGMVPVTGVFHEISGNGTVGPDGKVSGTIMVATASIDTRNTRRDAHLRSADFLDSGNAPYITFAADGVRACGQSVTVTGALTVRGRTLPLSVEATASVRAADQVLLDAEVGINRADFGVTRSLAGMASLNNTLTIHAVFSRQPVDASGDGRVARRDPARLNGE